MSPCLSVSLALHNLSLPFTAAQEPSTTPASRASWLNIPTCWCKGVAFVIYSFIHEALH